MIQQPTQTELDTIYQQAYFGHNKYRDDHTLKVENLRRLAMVRAHISDDAYVLEVGCGDGSFLSEAKHYYNSYGFDLSPEGVKIAQEKNPDIAHNIWVGRLEDQNMSKNYFDVICMWDVIEHLWDPYEVSRQLLGYLKPGGMLFLSTPNMGAPIARLMGKRWAFMTPPEHLSFFTRRSMTTLFEERFGAEIIHWHSLGKRANVGFILYKIGRVFPLFPNFMAQLFERPGFSQCAIYVPTADIQYVAIRKR